MSIEHYDEDCPGCRPAMIDPETGQKLPAEHPAMRAILSVWDTATPDEKRAFHDVCCNNSRVAEDLGLVDGLRQRMQEAITAMGN